MEAPDTPRRGIRSKVVDSPLPPGLSLPRRRHSSFNGVSVVQEVDNLLTETHTTAGLVAPQLTPPATSRPLVVGVAGGTGSGKTTLARAIRESLAGVAISYLSHDSYYRDLGHLTFEEREKHNFDHPDALDTARMVADLSALKRGEAAHIPTYDFATHSRTPVTETVQPRRVILVEGILIFADEALRALMDIKIFVDTADDVRLVRRLTRDIKERGRTSDGVIQQYLETVRPMHAKFVEPSKQHADVIVPVGLNQVALDLIISRLRFAANV